MISKAEKFYQKEKYKQAEELCLQVLETETGNVDALRLQSLIMLKTNRIPQGIEFLKIALAKEPLSPANNIAMGLYCMALHKVPEAINAFLKVYQADPDNTEALLYLGDLHSVEKDWGKALVFYALYINLDTSNALLNQLYANLLIHCSFKQLSQVQKNAMERVLMDDRVNARRMLDHWIYALFHLPEYEILSQAITKRQHDLDVLQDSLNSPFFVKGIEKLRHRNPAIEFFLTALRQKLLALALDGQDISPYQDFLFALSMQCWTNEYVFYFTQDEEQKVQSLRKKLEDSATDWNDSRQIMPLMYLYACYAPPTDITGVSLKVKKLLKEKNDNFNKFVHFQIDNPLEEERIKKSIPHLTEIDDSVSQLVKAMYEESPYPRGVEPVIIDKASIDETPYDMLFAGCGTGFQVLGFAQLHPNSTFTGVDLSSSSLAYAMRQTRQHLKLKPKQMRYGLGDILKLDQRPDRYDRIYCTGVLHHMEDPEKGLAVLKNILKPDGEMRIALYSATARREVVQTRDYIHENGYDNTKDDIRRFRHDILNLFFEKDHPKFIDFLVQISDFYTLSECRDLVFHVQEHRYTIPQILDMLDRHDLEFISFNIKHKNVKQTFAEQFPEPDAILDPMHWHAYEQTHPHTFVEMYDFNIRHKK